jgi:hypothetical protein
MKQTSWKITAFIFTALISAYSVFGQADVSTATLSGSVLDPNNAPIAGASVTVTNVEKGISKDTNSDDEGKFRVPLLQPGKYEIRVESSGFQTYRGQNIVLTIGQDAIVDIPLKLGEVATVVTVDTELPLIETTKTQQANTIEQRQIENLPNLNRSYTDIVFTLPGVVSNQDTYTQASSRAIERIAPTSGISIGGTTGRSNYVSIDGGENDIGSGGLRIKDLSIEAVQEYQVNRNGFNAEFGFTTGTALNVVTKSGTNAWHGSGYLFYRSDKTSARNALDFGANKPFERRLFPGFNIGGAIAENKLFVFSSYEGLWYDEAKIRRYNDSALLTTDATQNTYLATLAANTNPAVQAIGTSLRSRLTASNSAYTMKILNDSQVPFTAPNKTQNWMTRIDYQPNQFDGLLFRFSINDADNFLLSNDNADSPSFGVTNKQRDYTFLTSWSRAFTSGSVNQLRFQYARATSFQGPNPTGPGIAVQGVINYGPTQVLPSDFQQHRFQLEDVFAFTRGNHNLKTGLTLRPVKADFQTGIVPSGFFIFAQVPIILTLNTADRITLAGAGLIGDAQTIQMSSLQALATGTPAVWLQGFGNQKHSALQENIGAFFQDSWRVNSRLTLDLGLRFQHDGEPTPLSDNSDFAPRIALAWDIFGNGKTVLRAGGGKYDAPIGFHIYGAVRLQREEGEFLSVNTVTAQTTPSSVALWNYGVGLGALPFTGLTQAQVNAFGIATGPYQQNRRIAHENRDKYVNPTAYQASLSLQQEIIKDWSVELGYIFYRGNFINRPTEGNYRESGTCALASPTCAFGPQYVRINPAIAQEIVHNSSGNSTYHGGTLSLTKRFANNFQMQANYTYSRAMDDVFDFASGTIEPFPTRGDLEWARSGFDIRHNFVASGIISSPWKDAFTKDMTLSPIVFIRSGIPFNLYTGANNGDSNTTDRPFYASRNSGNGPNYFNVNMRLNKKILFKNDSPNGLRLELFGEATNILNKTNFLSVNDFIGTNHPLIAARNFNVSGDATLPKTSPLGFTNAHPPRQFQFGIKFGF